MLLVLVTGVVAVLVALVVSLLALIVSPLPFFALFRILSFNLFMYFSLTLRAASIRLGSFVTFCDVLSMFILRKREKVKHVIRQDPPTLSPPPTPFNLLEKISGYRPDSEI